MQKLSNVDWYFQLILPLRNYKTDLDIMHIVGIYCADQNKRASNFTMILNKQDTLYLFEKHRQKTDTKSKLLLNRSQS